MAGRFRSRTIWDRDGSGSTIRPPSDARSKSSTTRPCKPWGATRGLTGYAVPGNLDEPSYAADTVQPMELGHLPYRKGTYEDYVGIRGLDRAGKKKWRLRVADVVVRLTAALEPDDVVLGGGNVKKLKELPPGCRAGDNADAFLGGFRLWENA